MMIAKFELQKRNCRGCSPRERYTISTATESERLQIYSIRHDVYARELGQHPLNAAQKLQDSLDAGNIYLVARLAGQMAGFVSITPPGLRKYSIDKYFDRSCLPFLLDDDVYEVRLLTVLSTHRGGELAMLLMYAAFRWIESHGGQRVIAIGRKEILDLYLKSGLKPMGLTAQSGMVHYELLSATIPELRENLKTYKGVMSRIASKTDWQLNFPFHRPAGCFHGGEFFKAVGEGFQNLEHRNKIINADVLDAWFPPSPRVATALTEHLEWLMRTSPPTECSGMVAAIAEARGVKPRNILPGAGSSDLIFRALPRWLSDRSHVLILDPTYGEYGHVLEKVIGATVDKLTLLRDNDYELDLNRLQRAVADNYDLVVLVNPNSPTGRHIPRAQLEDILRQAPERTRIWIDETYVDYAGANESLERFAVETENVVVCKSMSKVYALSGLRAAYLCANPSQLEELRACTPPWVVSLPAQVSATVALQDPQYYAARYSETKSLRNVLESDLKALGLCVVPGIANFVLAHLPENGITAQELVARCRKHGLFIRDAALMGSQMGTRTIRIAVKDAISNERMVKIIASELQQQSDPTLQLEAA